jgi:RNA recognition motif-containing protein
MGKKLYVGSIPFKASENDLKELFSTVGEVASVKIITDMYTGQSKGFGFIEMTSEEDAKKAIAELNGTSFMEKTIIVNEARPQKPREKRGFGGDRGNYDRNRSSFGKGSGTGHRKGRR